MKHGPAFCCEEPMNEDWSYCPSCGEAIDWPQDPKEVAEREAAHQLRMGTDPLYKARYEAGQRLMETYAIQAAEHLAQWPDPILQREAP